jgi:hypothetical protein
MSDLKELKDLVTELEQLENKDAIVEKLQEIGKKLITEYEINIGKIKIIPLWLEAYYYQGNDKKADEKNDYKNCTGFIDPFVHGAEEQKGEENFGKFYFHHKTDDQRSGVDICLSLSNKYYLSFLLKYTQVNGQYTTQSQLSAKIRKEYDQQGISFSAKSPNSTVVSCTTRIGVSSKKEKNTAIKEVKEQYENMELAIVRDFHIQYNKIVSLPHKEELVKKYVKETFSSKEEQAEFCKNHINYIPKEFK